MPLSDRANTLLTAAKEKAFNMFGNRIISLYKLGSLGDRGDFSLCSDVDIALMLDKLKDSDEAQAKILWREIQDSKHDFADRFSLYWSSYHSNDFVKGKGRFPALDRLDLIHHAVFIAGVDRRAELTAPTHEELIIESAKFILSFTLAGEKYNELTTYPDAILKKGARYFTKFVLFPVRLIFTLDDPGIIGSNRDAVAHFNQNYHEHLPSEVTELISTAYKLRTSEPDAPVILDNNVVRLALINLYKYCIRQYCEAVLALDEQDLANQLQLVDASLVAC